MTAFARNMLTRPAKWQIAEAFEIAVRRRGSRRFIRTARRSNAINPVVIERRAVVEEVLALLARDGFDPAPADADHAGTLFDDLIAIEF